MRTLKESVADLPAGTPFEIYQDPDGIRRAAWIGEDGLRRGARVDGRGTLATLSAADPIYDAHCKALGCNPEDEVPCGNCCESIAACLTLCPECQKDPDSDVPCDDCPGPDGKPSGYVTFSTGRSGIYTYDAICPTCKGDKSVEAPYVSHREAALAKAREWKRAQSMEANPVPAGSREPTCKCPNPSGDAWRCAVAQRLTDRIACTCACHRRASEINSRPAAGESEGERCLRSIERCDRRPR